MTFQAGVEVGHPWKSLGFEEAMARVAGQPLFQMFFMIERDGLIGFGTDAEVNEEGERYNPNR